MHRVFPNGNLKDIDARFAALVTQFIRLLPVFHQRVAASGRCPRKTGRALPPSICARSASPMRAVDRAPGMSIRSRESPQPLIVSTTSSGLMKNSSSICSNSRERKVKFFGVTSLRNALPICAIPKVSTSTRRIDHVFKLRENRLRCFRAEIRYIVFGRRGPDVGFQHQVERAGFPEQDAAFRMKINRILHR